MYNVPIVLILKCLVNVPDKIIHQTLINGCEGNIYYQNCVENMLGVLHEKDLHTHEQCKAFIGKMFRVKFYELPINATDIEVCDFILK